MANINQYEVLTTDLLKEADRERILALVSNFKSPTSPLPENFSIKFIDHYGKIAIVSYRGTEVVLLFRRMTSRLTNISLDTSPQAFLKNADEAWIAFPLMLAYTETSLHEKIRQQDAEIKRQEQVLRNYHIQANESDELITELMGKRRKKAAKSEIKAPIPIPLESDAIHKALKKIKPAKLQAMVRLVYLWGQGFNADLVHGHHALPAIPVKYKKKVFNHGKRLDKLMKKAKIDKVIIPYLAPAPVEKKKKVVAKKKVVKKRKK